MANRSTLGQELLQQIADGKTAAPASEFLVKTREEVSNALEELIEIGARIRPLLVDGKRVGWVRGIHLSERKHLKRWLHSDTEFIAEMLRIGTSLTDEEIFDLSMVELRSITRVIHAMTDSDLRLFPYLAAFATTSVSEQLWYSRGREATSFRDRLISMPDGKKMRIVTACDQARSWATQCNYRIDAKKRLDASFNAVLTIRPMVGKAADPLSSDLKSMARSLQTDSMDPWRDLVKASQIEANFEDGWAHSEDDSIEGMKRELDGMISNDRHEQAVEAFQRSLQRKAEEDRAKMEEKLLQRRSERTKKKPMVIRTEEQIRAQMVAANQAREEFKPVVEEEPQSSLAARLAKYQ